MIKELKENSRTHEFNQENNQEFKIMLQEDQRMQENFKDCKNNLQQSSSSFLFLSFLLFFFFFFFYFLFFFYFYFFLNANARIQEQLNKIKEQRMQNEFE